MGLSTGGWSIIGAVVLLAIIAGCVFLLPGLAEALQPGLGLRGAAIAAFALTMAVLVVLLIAAGDGLIGEIQFVLPGFFVFFAFNWLLIAWVF